MRQLFIITLLISPILLFAQKNNVKINLSSIAINNYHLQYERQIAGRTSINFGIRVMPESKLPLQDVFEKYAGLDNENLELGRFRISNFALTPEFRFYLGKQPMKGFYIAPYARYASFGLSLPFRVKYTELGLPKSDPVDFKGTVTSFSGGLMFGTQFNLGKSLVLDIWWLGAHYGGSNGDLDFTGDLSNPEKRQAVDDALKNFDPSPFKYEHTVTATGATIKSTGPWAGVRGLGINLGFRF